MEEKKETSNGAEYFLRNVAQIDNDGKRVPLSEQQIKETLRIIEMGEKGYDTKVVHTRRGSRFAFFKPNKQKS